MSEVKLTEKQQAAVSGRGGALLVSAAAGSGKTKVLTERLIKMVADEGCDIDSFLIITYTNAAAAELRGKIIEALSRRIAAEPGNIRLHRQLERCYRAKISTIHSFCVDIIRQNAHKLDITPDFKVIDEAEADILREKVLGDVLEERYSKIAENSAFANLTDMVSTGRSDKKLGETVLEVYRNMQMSIRPDKWSEEQRRMMSLEGIGDVSETIWGKQLIKEAKTAAHYWREKLKKLLEDAECDEKLYKKYGRSLEETAAGLDIFCKSLDGCWDGIRQVRNIPFPRPGGVSGYDDVKRTRNAMKSDMEKISKLFENTSEELLSDLEGIKPAMCELFSIAEEFGARYEREKKRRGVIDFSDQEHYALRVLVDEDGLQTDAAKSIADGFTEIMVDEYQDVNGVQEAIFAAVSKNGRNIFMVGDVKQSIYRFRLADPGIFIEKYNSMKDYADAGDGEGRKIILSTNFRSRAGVLWAVNHIFRNIMSRELGEIAYTEEEYLYPGLEYPRSDEPEMELCIVDTDAVSDDDGETPEKTELEADEVAKRILREHGCGRISDGAGGLKRPEWGDFTVLLRSVKDKAAVYAASLEKLGIPVSVDKSEDFFQSTEILSMMSLLAVIDNPRQDIPLISAARSFIFGFTADDLAFIRSCDKKACFYDAMKKAAAENEKAEGFLKTLARLRAGASEKTADELLWDIYLETDAVAIAGAMPEGRGRQENLMTLLSIAQRYESEGYRGLFGFNTYLRETAQNGGISVQTSTGGEDNAVKIMSIHKSKGLEYPIVILADTAKRFNKNDARAQLPIHQRLGIGPEITDLRRKIKYPSVARMAVSRQIVRETLSEEMRVLYVALTRAKEKIIVFSSFKNAEKKIEKLAAGIESPIPPKILESDGSFADWIIQAALLRRECAEALGAEGGYAGGDGYIWKAELIKAEPIDKKDAPAQPEAERIPDRDELEKLRHNLAFSYGHKAAAEIPSKITSTELKGKFTSAEAEEEAKPWVKSGSVMLRPDFKKRDGSLTGAEKGTALHLVMQFIDFRKCFSLEGIEGEIKRLENLKIVTKKQAEAVSAEKIFSFFSSEAGEMIKNAENIKREFKFSLLVPADMFYNGGQDDEILLQGVIDCLIVNGDELTVLDYKTDYVNEKTAAERARFYEGQVKSYAMAMEKITGKKVARTGLYFFAVDKTIWM